jgi:hypothetical protein
MTEEEAGTSAGRRAFKVGGRVVTHDGFFARIRDVKDADDAQIVLDLEVAGLGRRERVCAADVRSLPTKAGTREGRGISRQVRRSGSMLESAAPLGTAAPHRQACAVKSPLPCTARSPEARAVWKLLQGDAVLGPWVGDKIATQVL